MLLVPHLEKLLSNASKREITLKRFYINPFAATISFSGVSVDNAVTADYASFGINILKLPFNLKNPTKFINRIYVSELTVPADFNFGGMLPENKQNAETKAFALPDLSMGVRVDRLIIKSSGSAVLLSDINLSLRNKSLRSSVSYSVLNSTLTLKSAIQPSTGSTYDFYSELSSNGELDVSLYSVGEINAETAGILQNINVNKIAYKGFEISDATGVFTLANRALAVKMSAPSGSFSLTSKDLSEFLMSGSAQISKINKNFSGNADFKGSYSGSEGKINIRAQGLAAYGFALGNYDLTAVKNNDGELNVYCNYGYGESFSFAYLRDSSYILKLILDGNTAGSAFGNLQTGDFKADFADLPVSRLPIVPFIAPEPSGRVSLTGKLNRTEGKISLNVANFSAKNINKTNIKGTLVKNNNLYGVNVTKSDNSIMFDGLFDGRSILKFDFRFLNLNVSNALRAFGYSQNAISGIASGYVKHDKKLDTEFDFKVLNGSLFGNKFKTFETRGSVNSQEVNISRFTLQGDGGGAYLDMSGLLGFSKENPKSSFDVKARNIAVSSVIINADMSFKGRLSGKNEVRGELDGNNISVAGMVLNKLSSDVTVSPRGIVLSSLRFDNGIYGNFKADFEENDLNGNMYFKNTDIKGIYPELSGILNAYANISGSFGNPSVKLDASVKNGGYSGIPFSFASTAIYEDGTLRIDKALLASRDTKVTLSGTYGEKDKVSVSFENLSEEIINKFLGFESPVKGYFSGAGSVLKVNGKPRLEMSIASRKVIFNKAEIIGFKSDVSIYDKVISLSGASARISDSEIKFDNASFDINSGKYAADMSLVNAHLGPADIFGNVSISGIMQRKDNVPVYSGELTFKNFWINRYKITSLDFGYSLKDRTLKIFQKDSSDGQLNAFGTLSFADGFETKNFTISKDSASFSANVLIQRDNINVSISGKNIDWEFLSDALNLPVELQGETDINLNFSGPLKNPKASLAVNSYNGSIMEVPFDSLEIFVLLENNTAEIKKARIYKKNEVNVSVSGHIPLWFDSSLEKEMKEIPMEIEYNIDDSKMNVLKYVTKGYITPSSGHLTCKGSVKGTYGKIAADGQLNISNGVLSAQNYLEKVKELSADITLSNNTVKFNKFSFKSGRGKASLEGSILLDSMKVSQFNLRFFTTDNKGMAIRVLELPIPSFIGSKAIIQDYSTGEPTFDLTLKGSGDNPEFAGWIVLENTRFSFPPSQQANQGGDSVIPKSTKLNLDLKCGKNTKFENSFAEAWINGTLSLRGTYGAIQPQGSIDSQKGTISYVGISFDLINARLEIADSQNIFISGQAETQVYIQSRSDYETLGMIVSKSDIRAPSIRFYSKDDPSLDSQTALARITGTENSIENNDSMNSKSLLGMSDYYLRQQALRLIDSNFATPFARTVLRKTGLIDNLKVSYVEPRDQSSLEPSPENQNFLSLLYGTKYSFEKNITNDLLLGYSMIIDQIEQKLDLRHEIEIRYRLANDLFLSGSYELQNDNPLYQPDRKIMLEHQIRFK